MQETIAFVKRLSDIKYEQLPSSSIERAKECLIDYLACIYAAHSFESSRITREYALENYALGPCTIIGSPEKLVPAGACLANGTAGHGADFDDCSNEGGGHPGAAVMPASISMSEYARLSGRDMLRCLIIGYETFIKIGKASNYQPLFTRGYHPTALFGTFGATMAASAALGLNIDQAVNAMGIAGSFVSGNLECYSDGSYTKRLHGGSASSAGVTAALLAGKGYTGPKSILEGPRGFYHAYCEGARPEMLLNSDETFEIDGVSFKPHACCRFNQAGIDAVFEIFREQHIDYRAIKSILIELAKTPYEMVGQPQEVKFNPTCSVHGQFSAPYSVAIACIEGKALVNEFSDESVQRPDIKDFLKKISIKHTPELDRFFPESFPTRLTITMEDGREFSKEIRYPKGDLENPLSWEEMLDKFNNCASPFLDDGRRQQVIETVRGIEKIKDVSSFTGLLRQKRS